MRAHVVLDDELVDEVDALAGRRRRSAFIEDAIRAKSSGASASEPQLMQPLGR